jgi:hypothetical protein
MTTEDLPQEARELRELFAYFGRAYYFAEVLHRGLCNLYVVLQVPENGVVTRYRVEEHFAAAFKMTLGQVWKTVANHFTRDSRTVLELAIERRNFVAHHFWYERAHLMSRRDGRLAMQNELADATKLFEQADALVDAVGPDFAARFGLDETHLNAAMTEILQGVPPEPLRTQRRLRKLETVIRAYEGNMLLLETDDGVMWQICDEGLGWCAYDRAESTWKKSARLSPYLPTTLNPRPSRTGPWNYDLQLGKGAALAIRPATGERGYTWSIRQTSGQDAG